MKSSQIILKSQRNLVEMNESTWRDLWLEKTRTISWGGRRDGSQILSGSRCWPPGSGQMAPHCSLPAPRRPSCPRTPDPGLCTHGRSAPALAKSVSCSPPPCVAFPSLPVGLPVMLRHVTGSCDRLTLLSVYAQGPSEWSVGQHLGVSLIKLLGGGWLKRMAPVNPKSDCHLEL